MKGKSISRKLKRITNNSSDTEKKIRRLEVFFNNESDGDYAGLYEEGGDKVS